MSAFVKIMSVSANLGWSLVFFCILGDRVAQASWYWTTEDAVVMDVFGRPPDSSKVRRERGGRRDRERVEVHRSKPPFDTNHNHGNSANHRMDKCFTPTEKEGECVPFRDCYPVLFAPDGELRNVGLAEVLFQSSGPCNSSLVYNIPAYYGGGDNPNGSGLATFTWQRICCTGYPKNKSKMHQSALVNKRPERIEPRPNSSRTPSIDPTDSDEASGEHSPTSDQKDRFLEEEQRESERQTSIAVPVLPEIHPEPVPHDLSPWNCPGRQMNMPRGQWPWMVALLNDGKHFCSGTLIDKVHVLTAAHCIFNLNPKDVSKVRIILGDRVMYSTNDGPHHWRKVVRITRHLQYNHHTLQHDIAILAMDTPVQYTHTLQPANLPVTDEMSHVSKAIVSGWSGVDIAKTYFEPRPPRDAVVELMSLEECRQNYDGFANGGITKNMLCTRANNSSCIADTGGPMMIKTENCWHVVGIVSWGLGGCGNFPDVYTNVARYMTWIHKNIKHFQHKGVHDILPP